MVTLGMMNSRMKDFYDMDVMLKHMSIDDHELESAILLTFKRRHVPLPTELPAAFTPAFIDSIKETQWQAFLQRSMLKDCECRLTQITSRSRKRLWPILMRLQDTKPKRSGNSIS